MAVSVHTRALSDARFGTVARICGLADADHARGKMLHIWEQCTQEQTHVLTEDDVISILGENAVEALVRSRLGVACDGGVRIRGTTGKIEWLGELKSGRVAGGEVRAATAERGPDGRMLSSKTSKAGPARPAQASTSPAPSSASSSSSSSSSSEIPDPLPPARDPTAPVPPPAPAPAPAAASPDRPLLALVEHARGRLDRARRLVDALAPSLPAFGGQPERDLLERLRETPIHDRQRALDHALDVLAAEATAANSIGDLRLAQLGGDRAWQRLQAMTPADAAAKATRRRDGPRGAPTGRTLTGAAAARAQLEELEARERTEGTGT